MKWHEACMITSIWLGNLIRLGDVRRTSCCKDSLGRRLFMRHGVWRLFFHTGMHWTSLLEKGMLEYGTHSDRTGREIHERERERDRSLVPMGC